MERTSKYYLFFLVLLSLMIGCRKEYEPSVIKANNRFLVFEGVINTGANAVTTITLSRTRNIYDTLPFDPELSAKAFIETEGGPSYPLQEQGLGNYSSANLNLSPAFNYRIKIATADGNEYVSDYVPVKQTPPIDSVSWEQDADGVELFVNTHDPTNETTYYRWEYIETWEYHAFFDTNLGFRNNQIYFKDSSELVSKCWSHLASTEILIGSSAKLNEDVISHAPITAIPRHEEKLIERYSILVKQYALTKEAYEHWEILQKNKRQRGTIFDAQPAQLTENIHCVTNPAEPVIGWVSASSIEEKRIFIRNSSVAPWGRGATGVACDVYFIDPANAALHLNDPNNAPAYFRQGALAITRPRCVDCRLNGQGQPVKPPFW